MSNNYRKQLNVIEVLVAIAGTKQDLAATLNITPQAVSRWIRKGRIPVARCGDVERAFHIPRAVLRPDIFESPQPRP